MSPVFKAIEHVIPAQHIREYSRATRTRQEDVLQLSVKQYIPTEYDDSPPPENSITIIGAHGNGFPKETYEPFWDDLYFDLKSRAIFIRGIWVADVSNQGASGVLNENIQGDSTSWFDHSRDLLHMINHFRNDMPRPLIGVGHSMGCAQLVHLSIVHPRLLSTLVLVEPVILDEFQPGPNPAMLSTVRRDIWETYNKAERTFRKVFASWDPRALKKFLQYGLRQIPTPLYKSDNSLTPDAVTLTTSKHQEAWAYTQINFDPKDSTLDRLIRPDWDPEISLPHLSSRPECVISMRNLPFLRPSVLYMFGGKSPLSLPRSQDKKMNTTGTGLGGNGGQENVEKKVYPNAGHLLILELPKEIAHASADWIQKWNRQWLDDEKTLRDYKHEKSDKEMLRVSEAWVNAVKQPADALRPKSGKL